HPRAGGQGVVPGAEPDRERARAGRQRRQGQAVGREGEIPQERDDVVDDGAGNRDRHHARDRDREALVGSWLRTRGSRPADGRQPHEAWDVSLSRQGLEMAVTRAIKEEELQELERAFKSTESAVIVDYRVPDAAAR